MNTDNWIEIAERLPESGKSLLFYWKNKSGKERISKGYYAAKYSLVANYDEWEDYADYDESKDEYYIPQGWYEWGWELETIAKIENVTHWQPLPQPPKEKIQSL